MNTRKPASLALPPARPGRRALLLGAACGALQVHLPLVAQPNRVLVVGAGAEFGSLQAALKKAREGDRIDMLPGTYRGASVRAPGRLHLRGLGPGVIIEQPNLPADDRGVLVIQGDVTVENLTLRGARRTHGNGAGIRFLDGRLLVLGCTFTDNEMGLLGSDQPQAQLRLLDSVFTAAPRHAGRLHHLLYASTMSRLEVQGCRFEGGWRGHLLKSRARHNDIRYNLLRDGAGGGASYELELAEGGINRVVGNVIVQGPGTQNRSIVAVGYDARPDLAHELVFAHNTVVSQAWWPARFLRIWDQTLHRAGSCTVAHNIFAGRGSAGIPQGSDAGGNLHLALSALEDVANDRFRPLASCAAPLQGTTQAAPWLTSRQFVLPVGTRERLPDGCPGAVGA